LPIPWGLKDGTLRHLDEQAVVIPLKTVKNHYFLENRRACVCSNLPLSIRTGCCILSQGFVDDEQLATIDFVRGLVSIYDPAVV
jgi:hypothetical protein